MRRFVLAMMMIAATAAPAFADANADAVKNGMLGFAKLTSYHMTLTDASGKKVELDYGGPTKEHITVGPIEVIVLGDAFYVKPQGSWMKMPAQAAGMMTGAFSMAVDQAHKKMSQESFTATDLGMKTIDGVAYHAYGVKSSSSTGHVDTMYINSGGVLSRITSPNDRGETTIEISKMNVPVNITAPI